MHDIEALIKEYCAQNLPPEPVWITILNRRFPKIAARVDGIKSAQWEIEDHLRSSYESYLSKGQSPENAWKLAQEHFGDLALISREICKARTQSHRCLIVRLMAIIALFALRLGNIVPIHFTQFLHMPALCCMAVSAAVGFLITRRRDTDSLRKCALCGAWLGSLWGIIRVITITVEDLPTDQLGTAVAIILLSTFYGLFLAVPAARGPVAATMIVLCQFGVLISLIRIGVAFPYPKAVDSSLLKMAAVASLVSILVGFIVFDIRRLHRRLTGVAVFGMVFAYIQILSNLRGSYTIFDFACATSIPPLIAVLIVLPIRKLQGCLLHEADG